MLAARAGARRRRLARFLIQGASDVSATFMEPFFGNPLIGSITSASSMRAIFSATNGNIASDIVASSALTARFLSIPLLSSRILTSSRFGWRPGVGTRIASSSVLRARPSQRTTIASSSAVSWLRSTVTYANGYANRRRIVAVAANTVMLGVETFADLKSVANGGQVQSSAGWDIRFETTAGVKLPHFIDSYNPATGRLVWWVRPNGATTIFMYYGKAGLAATEENEAATTVDFVVWWDALTGRDLTGQGRSMAGTGVDPFVTEVTALQTSPRIVNVATRTELDTYLAGGQLPNDRVVLTGNLYEGNDITISAAGTTLQPWTMCCNGSANLLQPKIGFKITVTGANCYFWGLKFQPNSGVTKTGRILISASVNTRIQRCEFSGWLPDNLGSTSGTVGHAIQVQGGSGMLLERCFIHDPGDWSAAERAPGAVNSLRIFLRAGTTTIHTGATVRKCMFASTIIRPIAADYGSGQADLMEVGASGSFYNASTNAAWIIEDNIFDGTGQGGVPVGFTTFDRLGDVDNNSSALVDFKVSGVTARRNTMRNFRQRDGTGPWGTLSFRFGERGRAEQNYLVGGIIIGVFGGKHVLISNKLESGQIQMHSGSIAWNSYVSSDETQACDSARLADNSAAVRAGYTFSGESIGCTNALFEGGHIGTLNFSTSHAPYTIPAGFGSVAYLGSLIESTSTFSTSRTDPQLPLPTVIPNSAVGPFADSSSAPATITPTVIGDLVAGSYDGVADVLSAPPWAGYTGLTALTLDAYVDANFTNENRGIFIQGPKTDPLGSSLALYWAGTTIRFNVGAGGDGFSYSAAGVQDQSNMLLAGTWASGSAPKLYQRGALLTEASNAAATGTVTAAGGSMWIGDGPSLAPFVRTGTWKRAIAFVRLRGGAISATVAAREALNISDPQSFYGIGDRDQPADVSNSPVAVPEAAPFSVTPNTATTLDVLANDVEPDAQAKVLVPPVDVPSSGTATISSGKVLYTPAAGFTGDVTLGYTMRDQPDSGKRSHGKVRVRVSSSSFVKVAKLHAFDTGQTIIRPTLKNSPDPTTVALGGANRTLDFRDTLTFLQHSVDKFTAILFNGTGFDGGYMTGLKSVTKGNNYLDTWSMLEGSRKQSLLSPDPSYFIKLYPPADWADNVTSISYTGNHDFTFENCFFVNPFDAFQTPGRSSACKTFFTSCCLVDVRDDPHEEDGSAGHTVVYTDCLLDRVHNMHSGPAADKITHQPRFAGLEMYNCIIRCARFPWDNGGAETNAGSASGLADAGSRFVAPWPNMQETDPNADPHNKNNVDKASGYCYGWLSGSPFKFKPKPFIMKDCFICIDGPEKYLNLKDNKTMDFPSWGTYENVKLVYLHGTPYPGAKQPGMTVIDGAEGFNNGMDMYLAERRAWLVAHECTNPDILMDYFVSNSGTIYPTTPVYDFPWVHQ